MKYYCIGKYRLGIDLRELTHGIIGVGSICKDGYHSLFFDLDEIRYDQLENAIVKLQKEFNLSNAYVFRSSSSSFHVIFLDKLTRGMVINVHDSFRDFVDPKYSCDGLINHDIVSLRRRYWTLRISKRKDNEIEYIITLKNRSNFWDKSNAHRKLLNKQHKLKIRKTKKFDDFTELTFDRYSAKRKLFD